MPRRLAFMVLIASLLSGCSLFRPRMPEALKSQMSQVLQEGATLRAMTAQGVNYSNFGNQLAKTRGAYDLALSMWPDRFAPEARDNFNKAFDGWSHTLYIWDLKINEKDNPVEPNTNGFQDLSAYLGEHALYRTWGQDSLVAHYRGMRYLPFDETIGILMSMADEYFGTAQELIMPEMK